MHLVLVNPEIPQNTGSIARSCAATATPLHIVGETPFEITDRRAKRAGLDYWPYVELHRHTDWRAFAESVPTRKIWMFTKFGGQLYYEAEFHSDDALVFGSETKGLPESLLATIPEEQRLVIPMVCPEVRSLNLSNAASIALYEARRQLKLDKDFLVRTRNSADSNKT
jgi:tRNA (cytidine/uridine-2'-O-)-methyltransferase